MLKGYTPVKPDGFCSLHFNFSITYRLVSKSVKPDALSQQFLASDHPKMEENVLPSPCFTGALTWTIKKDIQEALRLELDPGTGPVDKLFCSQGSKEQGPRMGPHQ